MLDAEYCVANKLTTERETQGSEITFGLKDFLRILVLGGGVRNVLYHVAIYVGRTEIPIEGLRPQASEIADLRYFEVGDVDEVLLAGRLAPNMAFLWRTHGHACWRR